MAGLFGMSHNASAVAAALAKKPEQVLSALDGALARGAEEITGAEKTAAPKFKTELANSILFGRKSGAMLEYDIVANSKHGWYVDQGTKGGGWAPLSEILKWIQLKRITARDPKMSEESLAKLIRLRIGQRGSKGKDFWEPTYESKKQRVIDLALAAVMRAMGRTA